MGTKDGTIAEFTLKAVVVGIVLGIVFGAANAYIGLKAAMTISASIPGIGRPIEPGRMSMNG